jgi:hypothetical protein
MRRLLILFFIFYVFICGCTEKRYFIGDNPVLYFSVDTVDYDIRSYSRKSDSGPDIGAYERQIGETSKK